LLLEREFIREIFPSGDSIVCRNSIGVTSGRRDCRAFQEYSQNG
jgi:hypothetical protein